MVDEFDLEKAESVLMLARGATGVNRAGDRLAMFPEVVETLGKTVHEVRRLRDVRTLALEQTREDMRAAVAEEVQRLFEHVARTGTAFEKLQAIVKMVRRNDGALRWWPQDEQKFSEAYDKLFSAHMLARLG